MVKVVKVVVVVVVVRLCRFLGGRGRQVGTLRVRRTGPRRGKEREREKKFRLIVSGRLAP